MPVLQVECRRCGACCEKGGPALHGPDLDLVRSGKLPLDDLITIRCGELAHNPLTDRVEPVTQELVKVRGVGREWRCCYFDPAEKGCLIYRHRPKACVVLKCWQPEQTLALIGQDLLSRLDLLAPDDKVRAAVLEYERVCPCPDMDTARERLETGDERMLRTLEVQANIDLACRDQIVRALQLSLSRELFLFGRPLFQLLQALDVYAEESSQGLRLFMGKARP